MFFKPEIVRRAIFGKLITIDNSQKGAVFNNYSGFYYKRKKDNKMSDDLISAIICFIKTVEGHKLWIYRNKNINLLPNKLLDKKNIEEL